MTHSDRWTTGGKPLLVDDKASFRKRIENRSYVSMDFDSVKVEMHGDVAITYGRYVSKMRGVAADRAWFSVWYEKVYAKRNGQWVYLSHRTVHGVTYGLTRADVAIRSASKLFGQAFSRHAVRVEGERHRAGAIADEFCGRRFAAADPVETILHDTGPASHVIRRGFDCFVAPRPDNLHSIARIRGTHQKLLRPRFCVRCRSRWSERYSWLRS